MIRVSDRLNIRFNMGMWVVNVDGQDLTQFVRLEHACKFIVDQWAGEPVEAVECQSMVDVMAHMGARLHDALTRIGWSDQLESGDVSMEKARG